MSQRQSQSKGIRSGATLDFDLKEEGAPMHSDIPICSLQHSSQMQCNDIARYENELLLLEKACLLDEACNDSSLVIYEQKRLDEAVDLRPRSSFPYRLLISRHYSFIGSAVIDVAKAEIIRLARKEVLLASCNGPLCQNPAKRGDNPSLSQSRPEGFQSSSTHDITHIAEDAVPKNMRHGGDTKRENTACDFVCKSTERVPKQKGITDIPSTSKKEMGSTQ